MLSVQKMVKGMPSPLQCAQGAERCQDLVRPSCDRTTGRRGELSDSRSQRETGNQAVIEQIKFNRPVALSPSRNIGFPSNSIEAGPRA
jgi:hypothetical protein